ncbi:MAG: hypothetical protein ACOCP8_04410 [archaeon]
MIDQKELLVDLKKIVQDKKQNGVKEILTTDLYREHQGHYHVAPTSPQKSFNSKFGMFLKDNQKILGIKEIQRDVNTFDDEGKKTSCSKWEII